jgi:RimJ/RimL family protein N-acetyltransferase
MNRFHGNMAIKGDKVKLVPISLKYAGIIFRELTEGIVKYLDLEKPPSVIEETKGFITWSIAHRKTGEDIVLVILYKDKFIGVCGIHDLKTDHPRMGLWLKKSAHGKGFGKESVSLLIAWARNNLMFENITYTSHIDNTPSIRIIESLGGVFNGDAKDKPNHVEYLILP